MRKLAKRTIAFACAALMTAGGLVQVSAASVTDPLSDAKLVGTANRISTTQVSATSNFTEGDVPVIRCTVYARPYVKVNGIMQYGKQESKTTLTGQADITAKFNVISGVGTTGYGGEHSVEYTLDTGSSTLRKTLNVTSKY